MQETHKDVNVFFLNQGVDGLLFFDNERIIKEKIGNPNFENIDRVDNNEDFTINLCYELLGLDCFVHYENSKFSYTSFHLQNLLVNSVMVKDIKQDDCIPFFKKYHSNNSIEFIVDIKQDTEEIIYFFENIGLTIWFIDDELSDISIEPVWE